jgi:osmotically-inducible protein OsmY
MKTDVELMNDVTTELAWDPAIHATGIGVTVMDGIVTVVGHLNSFANKQAIEQAIQRVEGVRGMALELDVKLPSEFQRSDSEIAQTAASSLRMNSLVPDGRIKVKVESGWVTLTGEVDWSYQANRAEQCIRQLAGVRGLDNQITIKPRASGKNIKSEITAALTRQAMREAQHISVEVEGGIVTLQGKVRSLAEREAAVGAAFSAPGVTHVVDKLQVNP